MGTQRVKVYEEPASAKATAGKPEKKKKEEVKVKEEKKVEAEPKEAKPARPPKKRGKKWQEVSKLIEPEKAYPISEALELLQKTSFTNFDPSVEVHAKLNPKKGQSVRGTLVLPHGSGKEPKVAIFNPDLLSQIQKGKIDFEVLLAKPEDMSAVSKVAKILGPRGLMPNPKSGTITPKPEEYIKKIKAGQIEYRADERGELHQIIGKLSFGAKKLEENLNTLISALRPYNPTSLTLCSTMGPGIKIAI